MRKSLPQQEAGIGGPVDAPTAPSPTSAPIIFRPPLGLVREPELWVIASGDRETWSGATVAWSEDGDWYPENAEGEIGPNATVGTMIERLDKAMDTTDWPVDRDLDRPYFTHHVRLFHRGTLRAGDLGALARQQTLFYLGDGRDRFELLCYSGATLVGSADSSHVYRLDGPARRGCYGMRWIDHPANSVFARLDCNVARISLPQRLIDAQATLTLRLGGECGPEPESHDDPAETEPFTYRITGDPVGAWDEKG